MTALVLIVAKCNVNKIKSKKFYRLKKVLIVAKCNVNPFLFKRNVFPSFVLIVAKCNVNVEDDAGKKFDIDSINSSKV